jgi:hypothetical protein
VTFSKRKPTYTLPSAVDERPTTMTWRPNAKYPWLIKRHNETVRLTDAQVAAIASLTREKV